MKNKYFYILLFVFCFFFMFMSFASADTVTCYSSVTDSTSYVNTLIDYYLNMSDFDPFTNFFVLRSDQYEYLLLYENTEILGDYFSIRYHRINNVDNQYVISSGSYFSNLSIVDNGYTYVGSVSPSLRSSDFDQSKIYYILEHILYLFIVVFVFYVFRSQFNSFGRVQR